MKNNCHTGSDINNHGFLRTGSVIFICLLLTGAAVRVYGAWQLRHNLNPDSGIVALMAKHIAEGKDFPVFFYGQAYMGSLEPMVSAFFCFLFGTSGFMVTLGTAFVGWLVMPAVYLWAKDAHSPAAGLAAMAWCMIGPSGYVHYGASPRGGYTVTILLAALILWLVSRLIADGQKNKVIEKGGWLILGLLAGLGWWSNQLIVSAILTAALMALVFLRAKVFSLNTIVAAAGFLIGSLPFWTWNFLHNWQSFEFAGSLGSTPFLTGLKIFTLERLPDLLDLNHGYPAWRIAGALIYFFAAVFFIFSLRNALKARHENSQWVYSLAALMFIVVSALIFSTSHFARMSTSRYLLPLVPAIAVVMGILTVELAKRRYYYLGVLPLLAIMANQACNLSWLRERGAGEAVCQRQIEECGRFLLSQDIDACYAPYAKHAWNFALREEICFCDLPLDRYLPYVRRAEFADRIAIFDNLGDINNFIASYGGSARTSYTGETPVCWNFMPPDEGLAQISPESIESIQDSLGHNILAELTDGNIDTAWESALVERDDEWLEIDFKTPQTVRMIRLLYHEYPAAWLVAGQAGDGAWKNITAEIETSGYLWSGPRPYWSYMQAGYRLECRIPPEKLKQLRIHSIQGGYNLLEIQFFSPGSKPESELASLKKLTNLIIERNLNRIYSDRWPANTIYHETLGAVKTSLSPTMFKECSILSDDGLWFTPRTALLIRREDAGQCRQTLAQRLVAMRQTEVGPWILFDFSPCEALGRPVRHPPATLCVALQAGNSLSDGGSIGEPGTWKEEYGRNVELQWSGFSCLAKNSKRWAAELVDRTDILASKGNMNGAANLLMMAEKTWPLYQPALKRLTEMSAGPEQEHWKNEYEKTLPSIKAAINFGNGLEFAGLSLSTNTVRAGEAFTIRYYWKYPETGFKGQPCVFVHFLNGDGILQDDHPLEKFKGADYQPYPELFVESRRLIMPDTARAGNYQIRIGLYDSSRKDLKRFAVKTELPERLNSVELPVCLAVTGRK
jgi:4-amino-4-deoxy-L-arabinose transferase-like glycosyltransferase